ALWIALFDDSFALPMVARCAYLIAAVVVSVTAYLRFLLTAVLVVFSNHYFPSLYPLSIPCAVQCAI
ncbi:MAG: hypothetical protein ACI9M1_002279, partial [Porticoccaceae bacterium]